MDEKIILLLREYGLSKNEIQVYVHLFQSSKLTSYTIAKGLSLHRSTVHGILSKLVNKGFVNVEEKNNKSFYCANEISSIISDFKTKESLLKDLIPEIEKIKSFGEPRIRMLKGILGQRQFNYEIFHSLETNNINEYFIIGNSIFESIGSNSLVNNLINEVIIEKGIIKNLDYKAIWNSKYKNSKEMKNHQKIGEHRFLDNISEENVTTIIFGNTVAHLYSTNIPHIIEIKSKFIAQEFKKYFNYLWESASS